MKIIDLIPSIPLHNFDQICQKLAAVWMTWKKKFLSFGTAPVSMSDFREYFKPEVLVTINGS